MGAFKTIKFLTVVSLILTSVSIWAQSTTEPPAPPPLSTRTETVSPSMVSQYGTFDNCKSMLKGSCTADEAEAYRTPAQMYYPNGQNNPGVWGQPGPLGPALDACNAALRERSCRNATWPSASCDSLYKSFQDASSKTGEQCSKEGMSGMGDCTDKIKQCSGMTDLDGPVGDDPMGGIVNILTGSNGPAKGCLDQSDDSAENSRNQIDDKIYQLNKEMAQTKGKTAQKKGEFSKKNAEIEKEKIKAQQEADKIKVENQKDLNQKKAAIDKQILETKAKEFNRLIDINKESRNLANAQFKIQQFMIQFADKQVQVKCGGEADKIAEQKRAGAVPPGSPSGTKPVPKKLTKKDQQEIDLTFQTCVQVAALSKKAELKKVQDEQAASRDKIATLQASNQQDEDSIRSAQTEFDEAKKIADQENKNADDVQLRTNTNLDKSLAEFKEQIDEEVKGIEAENQERLKQIAILYKQQAGVKEKYSTLPSLFMDRNQASEAYTESCCQRGAKDTHCNSVTDGGALGPSGTIN